MHDVYEGIKLTESFVFEFRAFLFRFLECEELRLRIFDIFRFPVSVASLPSCVSFVFEVPFQSTVFEFGIIMRFFLLDTFRSKSTLSLSSSPLPPPSPRRHTITCSLHLNIQGALLVLLTSPANKFSYHMTDTRVRSLCINHFVAWFEYLMFSLSE